MSNTSAPPQSTVVLPFLQPSGGSGPSSTSLYAGSVGANNQAVAYNKYDKVGGKRRRKHRSRSHRKRRTNKSNRKIRTKRRNK